jgi:hypothetical protein
MLQGVVAAAKPKIGEPMPRLQEKARITDLVTAPFPDSASRRSRFVE